MGRKSSVFHEPQVSLNGTQRKFRPFASETRCMLLQTTANPCVNACITTTCTIDDYVSIHLTLIVVLGTKVTDWS